MLYGLLALLIGLHLYVLTLPATQGALPETGEAEALWWGFWPVRYPPPAVVWLAAGVLVGVMLWMARRATKAAVKTTVEAVGGETVANSSAFPSGLIVLAILLLAAFCAFPIVHTRWGDAYILANAMAWPDPALRLTHSWQAPLDVFLHSQLWLSFHQRFEWNDATPVYRLLSPLAGVFYLAVVLQLSRMKDLAPAWLSFGLLTSLGVVQLFFGYVENYSFAAAGILAYLWIGLAALKGKRPLWLAALVLALLNATHPSTIVLSPSLLYVGWTRWQRGRLSGWRGLMEVALPVVLVAGSTLLLMETGGHGLAALFSTDRPGGGDGRWLVPLFATTTRWEHYTLFSWPHLRDFLNEQVLVAPVVLPSLLLIGAGTIRSGWRSIFSALPAGERRAALFLLMAAVCYWLFVWLWNPDYGGQRDWDLFSLSTIPSTLLLVWALPRVVTAPQRILAAGLPLILFQALHTAAFVYQNTLPWQWPG
ncbi:MAG: hypothetical protein KF753_13930 [Caldilineaceae bacterium]|nr:hypothetical protein [Caldilineaceae bacterium]